MKSVEFLFDYASPWSFLANEILTRKLPGVRITYRPIYLRGLESFSTGLPYSSAKLAYLTSDLVRCAAHEGVSVSPPAEFPVNGLYALRGAIAAQEQAAFEAYHLPMFRAVWQQERAVSSREGAAAFVREIGLAEVADAMDAEAVKAKLRENTEQAKSRGVFGVPTFFVGEEMFWGHDRLDYVARALAL